VPVMSGEVARRLGALLAILERGRATAPESSSGAVVLNTWFGSRSRLHRPSSY